MIGEIERLLLNKLNNGERYFCSSELPKDESSLFELDSATRRELARLTSDGVIRKAETGAYEILLDIGAMRERIVRSSGKRKQKKQLKPDSSGFSDMQIAACRWQFSRIADTSVPERQTDDDEGEARKRYLEERRRELLRRLNGFDDDDDDDDDDNDDDDEEDNCREDAESAGYGDDDANDSELKTKLRTLMADASPEGKDKLSIVRYAVEHGSVTVQILIHELGFSEKNAREMIRKLNAEGILGNRGKTSYPSLISYDLYIECRAAQENSENKREQTDLNDPDDVDTEDGRGEDGKDASGEENAASDDFEEKVRVCLKALIYDDLTLSRTKALLKARGALFVANRIGAEGIISIYDAIVQALDCMTDYQFLRLRTQLSSGE